MLKRTTIPWTNPVKGETLASHFGAKPEKAETVEQVASKYLEANEARFSKATFKATKNAVRRLLAKLPPSTDFDTLEISHMAKISKDKSPHNESRVRSGIVALAKWRYGLASDPASNGVPSIPPADQDVVEFTTFDNSKAIDVFPDIMSGTRMMKGGRWSEHRFQAIRLVQKAKPNESFVIQVPVELKGGTKKNPERANFYSAIFNGVNKIAKEKWILQWSPLREVFLLIRKSDFVKITKGA